MIVVKVYNKRLNSGFPVVFTILYLKEKILPRLAGQDIVYFAKIKSRF